MAKAGITQHLEVTFGLETLEDISKIEFLFRQVNNMNGMVYKKSVYDPSDSSSDVTLVDNSFLIPFSKEDSYLFKQNAPFYMDTRISLTDSDDNPETEIVEIFMNPTLFRSDD